MAFLRGTSAGSRTVVRIGIVVPVPVELGLAVVHVEVGRVVAVLAVNGTKFAGPRPKSPFFP